MPFTKGISCSFGILNVLAPFTVSFSISISCSCLYCSSGVFLLEKCIKDHDGKIAYIFTVSILIGLSCSYYRVLNVSALFTVPFSMGISCSYRVFQLERDNGKIACISSFLLKFQ